MKDKCIAIVQKQIIMKVFIWWRESYKTLTRIWKDSWNCFARVLARGSFGRVRLAESRRISKPTYIYTCIICIQTNSSIFKFQKSKSVKGCLNTAINVHSNPILYTLNTQRTSFWYLSTMNNTYCFFFKKHTCPYFQQLILKSS